MVWWVILAQNTTTTPEADPGLAGKIAAFLGTLATSMSAELGIPLYFVYYLFGCIGITLIYIALVTVENILRWLRYMIFVLWALFIVGLAAIISIVA